MLWEELRATKLGLPIRRQHPIGSVVVDFYCPRAKVAIELDGAHHRATKDDERDRLLLKRGIVVVRFENFRVRDSLSDVVAAVRELVLSRAALRSANDVARDAERPETLHDGEKRVSASSPAGRVVTRGE